MTNQELLQFLLRNEAVILAIATWEMTLKGIAMWNASKRESKVWFAVLLVFNTVGLLPIIYLLLTRYENKLPKSIAKLVSSKK